MTQTFLDPVSASTVRAAREFTTFVGGRSVEEIDKLATRVAAMDTAPVYGPGTRFVVRDTDTEGRAIAADHAGLTGTVIAVDGPRAVDATISFNGATHTVENVHIVEYDKYPGIYTALRHTYMQSLYITADEQNALHYLRESIDARRLDHVAFADIIASTGITTDVLGRVLERHGRDLGIVLVWVDTHDTPANTDPAGGDTNATEGDDRRSPHGPFLLHAPHHPVFADHDRDGAPAVRITALAPSTSHALFLATVETGAETQSDTTAARTGR